MSNLLMFEEHSTGCKICRFRKENYPNAIPQECKECYDLKNRTKPYIVRIPMLKDIESLKTPNDVIREYIKILNEDIPTDSEGRIQEFFFDWAPGTPKETVLAYYQDKIKEH